MTHIQIKTGDAVIVTPDDDIEEAWPGEVVQRKGTKVKVRDTSDDPSCHGHIFNVEIYDLEPKPNMTANGQA